MKRSKQLHPVAARNQALVYCRVSTKAQEDGTSLDTQAEACVSHAEKLGYSVTRVTKEIYSGAELWDRPLLSRDREAIRRGEFQVIICYAIDRLSRNVGHLTLLLEEAERAGCRLLFVTEDLDSSPEGKLLHSVRGYVAEIERLKIKERTIRGRRAKVASGKIVGRGFGLFGYTLNRDVGRRTTHASQAAIVRRIFQEIASGYSAWRVADGLDRDHIPTPSQQRGRGFMTRPNKGWEPRTIRGMIRARAIRVWSSPTASTVE